MARIRVIAYFMHETEREALLPHLSDSIVTDGFAVGEIDDTQMAPLEQLGIIFQEIPEAPAAEAGDTPAGDERVMGVLGDADPALDFPPPVASNTFYLTLSGPLLADWRTQLEGLGVEFRAAIPDYCWVTRIPPIQLANVQALPFVRKLEMRDSDHNLPTKKEVETLGSANDVRSMITYDVLLDKDAPLADFVQWLNERSVMIAAAQANKVRIYLLDNDPQLQAISALTNWVIDIQPYIPPQLHNDHARVLLGADGPTAINPPFHFPFEGETEIVGIADTGLDDTHPDFANRIAGVSTLGRPGDSTDPHGHGTHVAGSILGDGTASQGVIKGIAPRARIFFQSLLDKSGELGGLPFRLETLFDEAYAAGARIHNNSWGAATNSIYRMNSREVDEYVNNKKDMLIVISAGNDGTAADPVIGGRNSAPGFVDWLSIGAPATAKNGLTVGASRSDRTVGGFSTLTYGSVWPRKFSLPPLANDTISGDAQSIAGFSSRGPSDDRRIKPDVVAPGTDILSCRSSSAPLRHFWGPDPVNPKYAYMGGTSMSAPLVSGCAAVVRQYYTQKRNHSPSAALLKATLINSTQMLSGASAVAEFPPPPPNYHQGFGSVYLPMAVPNTLIPGFGLEFYDNWESQDQYFAATGGTKRFNFNLNAGGWLRITLAYTDLAGRALQNNLNLFVQLPDGSKTFGNLGFPQSMNRPDTTNNVEIIRLPDAQAGTYWIQVVASNLLGSQDFALVVTGNFSSPMVKV